MSWSAPCDSSHAYRRQARRLRGVYAKRPDRLYHSLRRLSDGYDAGVSPATPSDGSRLPLSPDHTEARQQVNAFAAYVAGQLEGKVLRYSARVQLLAIAQELGIGRFHANLIIAAVQHQRGQSQLSLPAPRRRYLPPTAVLFLVIQSLILVAAWAIFVR